ncbi:hypothetical protein KVF89_14945 [Nocardioides carbamazepini]|uniref:hypothetical protein n=1 Tax=Nocardioides carbamazepini TaxID=2854259 RepID=UPI00214A1454|nr:hypothetical protein [Nocardioides carbamazepini]MCR1783835.1 hypothetical protein [Nocardioides carbamazepini]
MMRIIRSLGRGIASQAIAILALTIAVSGTAYAVAAKNSVVSSSIKNGQVKTKDLAPNGVDGSRIAPNAVEGSRIAPNAVDRTRIAPNAVDSGKVVDDSLTGADIAEGSLGIVPSARTSQLGGLAWSSPVGGCTPATTTTFEKCVETTITMPAAGRLVLIGQVGISHRTDNQYQATGHCGYRVNGTNQPIVSVARNAGNLAGGWNDYTPMIDTVTVPAGPVTIGIWCVDSYYSKFTDVKFAAIAASPSTP